ncbi:hypothetical protein BTVI_143414 [Pitangus sulphuratus]|nr:hypothetical protein BTVI_143414 [Pitangus sulphuratus]
MGVSNVSASNHQYISRSHQNTANTIQRNHSRKRQTSLQELVQPACHCQPSELAQEKEIGSGQQQVLIPEIRDRGQEKRYYEESDHHHGKVGESIWEEISQGNWKKVKKEVQRGGMVIPTTSLGSLIQFLTTPLVKKFFLMSNLNLSRSILNLFPLILLLVTWEKRPHNKRKELEAMMQQANYDTVVIMKTCWDKSHNWSAVMDGYKLCRKDRQGRR